MACFVGFCLVGNPAAAQSKSLGEYYKTIRAVEVLWSEDWTGGAANQTPATYPQTGTYVYNGGTVTYTYTDGSVSGGTKLYEETTAGGTSPELLLGKGGATWTIAGIPTGGATMMTLTFLSNNGVNTITATNGVIVGSVTTSDNTRTYTLTNANGATSFDLTLSRTVSSNTRLDNFVLSAELNSTPYSLSVASGIANGSIALSHTTATEGTAITVTATPAAGYRLGNITYTPDGGSAVIVTGNTFLMPAANVVVSAVFVLEGSDSFEKLTEAPSDWTGDYILAYKGNGYLDGLSSINTSVSSYYGNHIDIIDYLHNDNITVDANETTLGMVIHIEPSNGYHTIYLTGSGYLGYDLSNSGSSAQPKSLTCAATVSSNQYRWIIKFIGGAVIISNAATPNRMLQYDIYNTPRKYACYEKSTNVVNAELYKYYETAYDIQANGSAGISSVSINGDNVNQKEVKSGKTVTLAATLEYCHSFTGWYNASTNALVSTDNPYTFTATDDVNLIARTQALTENTYAVNVNVVGEGSVSIDGNSSTSYSVTSCEQPVVTLTATPNDVSWAFDGWYDGATIISNATSYQYHMPAGSTTITAKFTARNIYIYPTSGTYPAGTVVTITTNPSAAFRYTTDGSTPTNASTMGNGTATYVLTESTTVNAALASSLGNVTGETYVVPKQKDPDNVAEGLHLNKYLNGNFDNNCANQNTDCNYAYGNGQITLESYTTASLEAAVSNEPTDFLFVLDYSDIMAEEFESGISRLEAMKNAVNDFLVTLGNNPSAYSGHSHRVGFLTFNSWGYLHYHNPDNDQLVYFYNELDDQPTTENVNGTGWQRYVLARSNCLFSFDDPTYDPFWAWSLLKNSVAPSEGNMPDRAMAMIEDVFNYNGSDDYTFTVNGETKTRRRIIITFTDGVPGNVTSHSGDWTFPSVTDDGCDVTDLTGHYSTPIANKTLSYMSALKSEYNAVSYSIGIHPGADGTGYIPTYQGSNGTNDYYTTNENGLILNANRFLHLLSSNSNTASSLCSNDWSNKNYYIAANNLVELATAFSNIAASVNPDIAISSNGIVQDMMADYFVIPATTQESDILTYTQEFLGLNNNGDTIWGELVPVNVTVHFTPDHKTIITTGFDYDANTIYLDESTTPPTPHGNKLVILVPIAFETDEEAVCGTFPTNDWVSGVFDGTGEPIAEFNSPLADVRYGKKEKTIEDTACDSYTWLGNTYTESGTYHFDTLAANGCDSTVYLNLTIHHSENVTLDPVSACGSYTWHEVTYTESQTLEYEGQTEEGCQLHETLALTIYNPQNIAYTVEECESYTWTDGDGTAYNESGTYTYSHEDANGCTQVDTLHLTINQPYEVDITTTVCASELPYEWNGVTFTGAGSQTATLQAQNNCDSIVNMTLNVNDIVITATTQTACDAFYWEVNGMTYYESIVTAVENTTEQECIKIDSLYLTINHTVTYDFEAASCGSYSWNGTDYYASGDYEQQFTLDNGCDSIVTLHLTINNSMANEIEATACNTFEWNGQSYDESGVFTQTFTSASGCDSVVTLNLTINYAPDAIITGETNPVGGSETSYAGYHYTIELLNEGAEIDSVTWSIDCPNWNIVPVGNGEESDLFIYTYIPSDSVALTATVYNSCGSVTTTLWLHVTYHGTEENENANSGVAIMPNPNNGDMKIRFEGISGEAQIRVFDLLGNIIDIFNVTVYDDVMIMPYTLKTKAEATYYFLITTENATFSRKVTVRQ